MNKSEKIRVLLVDDHSLLRNALAIILHQVEDIQIVGSLSSGEELIDKFRSLNPDVIIIDIMLVGITGIEATRLIKERNTSVKIILLSSEIRREFVSTGIQAGIDGYLTKDVEKDILVKAIHTVYKGQKYFNEAITALVFEDFYKGEREGRKRKITSGLTKRENEILEIVAIGKSNREIADLLFISTKTVETHKTNVLEKLGLKNTAELVRYAIKNNIITIAD